MFNVQLFIDTSEKKKVLQYKNLGLISGCTTNPKIMSKQNVGDREAKLEQLSEIIDGPVSGEVTTNNKPGIVKEAEQINSIGENINVKIPANRPGFAALSELQDVSVNMTACMSPSQVFAAEKAGADYASLFMGRISDMGFDPAKAIEKSNRLADELDIIVGSIRKVQDIQDAFLAGADIVTTPPKFIDEMITHKKTDEAVEEFLES
jgi:transaldolase